MRYFQLLLLPVLFMLPAHAADNITVANAWIKEAPPGVKVLAGYMTIQNKSASDIKLVGAGSSQFSKIEFHFTRMEYGVAKMIRQNNVTIPGGSSFSFSPGSYHLMLFNPGNRPESGDIVPLELSFSDGTTLSIEADVRRGEQSAGHSHH